MINRIIDDGRTEFEKIIKKRRTDLAEIVDQANKQQLLELLKYGGDGLHVNEIPHIEESFFLTQVRSLDTISLIQDNNSSNTTVIQFQTLLDSLLKVLESFQALGAILQCNGSSYGVVFHKNSNGIEISIFDSHGSFVLNGHSNAFIYLTDQIEDAAQFLGNLIRFDDTEHAGFELEDLNRMAVTLFKPRIFLVKTKPSDNN